MKKQKHFSKLFFVLLTLLLVLPFSQNLNAGPFDSDDEGVKYDWNYHKVSFDRINFGSQDWPNIPTAAEINTAKEEKIAEFRKVTDSDMTIKYYYDGSGNAIPTGRSGEVLSSSFRDVSWSDVIAVHKPHQDNSDAVILFVSQQYKNAVHRFDAAPEFRADGYPELLFCIISYDKTAGKWVFPGARGYWGIVGSTEHNTKETLIRQFTDDLKSNGFAEGFSSGESPNSASPNATATDGTEAVSVTQIWNSPAPEGFEGIGSIPAPANFWQAITGVVIPGLIITIGGLLGGLGGVPSIPSPQPPPLSAEDAIREAAEREAAERQADWVRQREEDLRQVREQKSFINATAAGTSQAGFNIDEHNRQLADLTRRETELTNQISSAGGNTNYVAKDRGVIGVSAGYLEAIRIAQEYSRQQALAAARVKMEELERQRIDAERGYNRNVRDGFINNVLSDLKAIPGQLKDNAISGLKTIGTVVHDVGKAITSRENLGYAGQALVQTIKDIITHPIDSTTKVAGFYGEIGKGAARAGAHIVTHPIETIKAVAGIDNWERVIDPNVPITERLGRALVGAVDAIANIAGVKAIAGAAEGAVKSIGKALASPAEIRQVLKDAPVRRAVSRWEQIGDGKYSIVEDASIKLRGKDGKLAGSDTGRLGGMTEQSRRHAQLVADRYGVKLDVRSTTRYAHDPIAQGRAVPKAPHCKSKTINDLDVILGAKTDNRGLAGYFKPNPPPIGHSNYGNLLKRYNERLEEFKDQAEHLRDLEKQGKCYVKDGVVYDTPTGKPYTGDHDIFEIRDATSGKPLTRYQVDPNGNIIMNADGTPKLNPVREQVIKELQQPPFSAQHGAHMDWKYDHLNKNVPAGSPTGTKSDFAVSQGIDQGVTSKHSQEGGDALITFVGGSKEPVGSWFRGSR